MAGKTTASLTANPCHMTVHDHVIPEAAAEMAFSKQAPVFDELYGRNSMISYKRERVRNHVLQFIGPGSSILELNAGTGEDAIYFARMGHRVHATDVSPVMLDYLKEKLSANSDLENVSTELCSFNRLENLLHRGPYDHLFSNFAGLNCTPDLGRVLDDLPPLVKTGGFITLVIMPKLCLWELLLVFKGKFKTAFRRFSGKNGTTAKIEKKFFHCWYYNPSFIQHRTRDSFECVQTEGLCSLVPPSYFDDFDRKNPKLFRLLSKAEKKFGRSWPWKNVGDYYIITLRKK